MKMTHEDLMVEAARKKVEAMRAGTLFPQQRASKNGRILTGRPIVFYRNGDPTTEYELYTDVFERVMPTAVDAALKSKADVILTHGHDLMQTLGRVGSGTLKLTKTTFGLEFECELGRNAVADYILSAVERRDLDNGSFTFTPVEEAWKELPSGATIRELHSVALAEICVCTRGAYAATSAGVRTFAMPGTRHATPIKRRFSSQQFAGEVSRSLRQMDTQMASDIYHYGTSATKSRIEQNNVVLSRLAKRLGIY